MRYKIEGESQTTHQAVTVIVEADSTLGARTQAADMGIDIVTLGVVDEADYAGQEPMPIHSAVSHRSTTTIVLIALLGVFAVMFIFGAAAFWLLAVDSSPAMPAVQVTQPAPVLIEQDERIVPKAVLSPDPASEVPDDVRFELRKIEPPESP